MVRFFGVGTANGPSYLNFEIVQCFHSAMCARNSRVSAFTEQVILVFSLGMVYKYIPCVFCFEAMLREKKVNKSKCIKTLPLRFQDRSLTMDVRLGALRLYRRHLVDQYSDRCAYWALKDVSSEAMSRTLTITTDGADQESQSTRWYSYLLIWFGIDTICISMLVQIFFSLMDIFVRKSFETNLRPNIRSPEIHCYGLPIGQARFRDPNSRYMAAGLSAMSFGLQSLKKGLSTAPAWFGNFYP